MCSPQAGDSAGADPLAQQGHGWTDGQLEMWWQQLILQPAPALQATSATSGTQPFINPSLAELSSLISHLGREDQSPAPCSSRDKLKFHTALRASLSPVPSSDAFTRRARTGRGVRAEFAPSSKFKIM